MPVTSRFQGVILPILDRELKFLILFWAVIRAEISEEIVPEKVPDTGVGSAPRNWNSSHPDAMRRTVLFALLLASCSALQLNVFQVCLTMTCALD